MNPIQQTIEAEIDLSLVPEKEKEEFLIQAGALIYQNVLIRVLEIMPDEKQDEFEKILDNNAKPEEVFEFLKAKVENFERIVQEEVQKFKEASPVAIDKIEK